MEKKLLKISNLFNKGYQGNYIKLLIYQIGNVSIIGLSILFSVLYIKLGGNFSDLGFFTFLSLIIALPFDYLSGVYSDKYGPRKILLFSLFFKFLGFLGFLLAYFFNNLLFIFTLSGYMFFSLSLTFRNGSGESLLYNSLKEEGKENIYKFLVARMSAIRGLFSAIFIFLIGYISKFNILYSFSLSGILLFLSFISLINIKELEYYNKKKNIDENKYSFKDIKNILIFFLKKYPYLLGIFLSFGLMLGLFLGTAQFKTLYMNFLGLDISYSGLPLSLLTLFMLIFGLGIRKIDKYISQKIILFFLISYPLIYTSYYYFSNNYYVIIILGAVLGALYSILKPYAINDIFNHKEIQSYKATLLSIIGFLGTLIGLTISLFYKFFIKEFGFSKIFFSLFIVSLIITLVNIFIFIKYTSKKK